MCGDVERLIVRPLRGQSSHQRPVVNYCRKSHNVFTFF